MCKTSSYLGIEALEIHCEKGVEEVCTWTSLSGLSKDWTQGKNVQSFIELVGEGMC